MSQAWASLSKASILFSICIIMSACNGSFTAFEDDADLDTDAKTVDIELENAEEVTLAVLQSSYFAHRQSALYTFLDASDLPSHPENAVYDPNTKLYQLGATCTGGGTALFGFSRAFGEEYKAGDRISLSFDKCGLEEGLYNGSLEGRYTKIKGLNNAFIGNNTQTCLANLLEDLELDSNQVIYVSGDDLKFREVEDTLEVDVLDYVYAGVEGNQTRTDLVLETYAIPKAEKVIFVNFLLDPPVNAVTSVDGDQLYSVDEMVSTKHACQNYERTLSVTLKDFSHTNYDDLTTTLNGAVTLFEAQDTPVRLNQEIIDSNFQTTVKQGNLEQSFRMTNYRAQKALQLDKQTYGYLFQGFVSSPAIGGTVELTNLGKLFGNLADPYPSSGSLEIKGQGLERILIRLDQQNIQFQIDSNGDSTGNGFSDFDVRVDSRWEELYAREFQF